ncbi:MAG TPA: hypothetical protein DDZ67_09020 [Xanthomonadaceae bacterium]|nr:hypothetical protein [Xanthomonadaceae bacterium]
MASELTVDAVRMALDLSRMRAEVTGWNIVNASVPGASFFVVDQSAAESALGVAAGEDTAAGYQALSAARNSSLALVEERFDVARPGLDELVADSVSAGLQYQLLSEALGRHFGLMRLAVTGRSGA